MKNKGNLTLESTNKLLMVLIALLLRRKEENIATLRQQVKTLSDLGLKPLVIAEILGRSSNYINKEIYSLKKEEK